jgi:hypothetical protein
VIARAPGESLELWAQPEGQAARTELFEQAVHAQQKTYADTVAGARQAYAGARIDELIGERVDAVEDVPVVAGEWAAPALLALPSGPWEPAAIDVALFDGDSLWSGLDWTQQGYASEFSLRHGEFLQSASGEFRDEYGSSLGFYDLSTRSIGDRSLSYDPNDPASVLGSVTDQASWSGQTWTGPSAWGGADSAWSGPDSSWWTFSTDDLPGLFSTLTTAGSSLDSTTLTGTGSASAGTYDTAGYDTTTGDGSTDGSTSTGTSTVGTPLEGSDQLPAELQGEGAQGQYPLQPAEGPRPDGLRAGSVVKPFIVSFSTPTDDHSLLQFHVQWAPVNVPIGRQVRLNTVWAPNGHIFVLERNGLYVRQELVEQAMQQAQAERHVLTSLFWDRFFQAFGVRDQSTLLPAPPPMAVPGAIPQQVQPQQPVSHGAAENGLDYVEAPFHASFWNELIYGEQPAYVRVYYDATGPHADTNRDMAEAELRQKLLKHSLTELRSDVHHVVDTADFAARVAFDSADDALTLMEVASDVWHDRSLGNLKRQGLKLATVVFIGKIGKRADDAPLTAGRLGAPTGRLADHHIFPRQFEAFFSQRGIDIHSFTITVDHHITHLRGIHGRGNHGQFPGRWNQLWQDFIDNTPNASALEVYQFAGRLLDDFGLGHLPIHPHGK